MKKSSKKLAEDKLPRPLSAQRCLVHYIGIIGSTVTSSVLKAWKEQREAEPDDPVFIDENGGAYDLTKLAERLRTHLKTAEGEALGAFRNLAPSWAPSGS